MESKINTVAEDVDSKDKNAADLDQALAVAGLGWYNIKYCLILALFLISAIVEPVGYSFVLPAAMCDLDMTDAQRGFIASIPYIGIVATSFPWGFLVDTRGRKKMVILASLTAGVFGILAGFMPDLITFAICKFLTALCIACPAAVPYTFIVLAWAILPLDFRIDFGLYLFRPWRLLTMIYAGFYILAAVLLLFGPESPKYLVSQGKMDEALKILQVILNGLYMWVPDVLNRVLTGDGEGKTACDVIFDRLNQTVDADAECVDTIENITFVINSVANISCAVLSVAVSSTVKFIGKKRLLILLYFVIGTFCVLINFITQDMLFAVLLSSFPIMGLALGPVNAYAVEIFPTNLRISPSVPNINSLLTGSSRLGIIHKKSITQEKKIPDPKTHPKMSYRTVGMAIGLTMMIGRIGSIVGTNVAGILLNVFCELTFYLFGGLLLFCGFLSFLLPSSRSPPTNKKVQQIEDTRL
ncbi:hypothetical protein HF086_005345 [Spodoptera exigua]|uniref:Major facilitator superfamily (MFS) profile domain-containing protein n=1 Tax=Spodoptera exigua TaxID=7107 RepID=A0A922MSY7_SPOEX|nr:hypothetical protein HF086_005345 [Spodoptera exigua]